MLSGSPHAYMPFTDEAKKLSMLAWLILWVTRMASFLGIMARMALFLIDRRAIAYVIDY